MPAEEGPYTVMVESHGAYREPGYKHGTYPDATSAVAACRRIVDDFLMARKEAHGQSAESLFRLYSLFGEDPYVLGPDAVDFSSWDYARQRCADLCGL